MNCQCCSNEVDPKLVESMTKGLVALLKDLKLGNVESSESPQAVQSVNAMGEWQTFQKQVEECQQPQHQQPLSQLNTPILVERVNSSSSPHDHVMGLEEMSNEQDKVQCSPIDSTSPTNVESNQCENPWLTSSESLINIATRCKAGSSRSSLMRTNNIDCEPVSIDFGPFDPNYVMRPDILLIRVLRLFRQMHYYMNDVLPSPYSFNANDNYAYMLSPMMTMLRKLNVAQQVKQASDRCKIFMSNLDAVVDANKIYDLISYNACKRLLEELRYLIVSLDTYRNVALNHTSGEFNTPIKRASAERLVILLSIVNNKIRQTHLYVQFSDWSVQKMLHSQEPTMMYKPQRDHQQFIQMQTELERQALEDVDPCSGALFTVSQASKNSVDRMVQITETSRGNDCIAAPEQNYDFNTIFYGMSEEERNLIRYIG